MTRRAAELLTETEHELVDRLASCANLFRQVIHAGDTVEAIANIDLHEAVDKIHQLQNMVLAQAAARAYPGRYRLMGEVFDE